MRPIRNIYAIAGMGLIQVITASSSRADGTNGFFKQISEIVSDAGEGKSVAGKITGAARNAVTAGNGFAALSQFQAKAKSGPVSDSEMRAAADKAFGGTTGVGGVVGALITKPFARVGVNNAVNNKNEYALADAILNGDQAQIEARANELAASRAYVRTEAKLADPTWDIITAGTTGRVRAAAMATQFVQNYASRPQSTNNLTAPNPAPRTIAQPTQTVSKPPTEDTSPTENLADLCGIQCTSEDSAEKPPQPESDELQPLHWKTISSRVQNGDGSTEEAYGVPIGKCNPVGAANALEYIAQVRADANVSNEGGSCTPAQFLDDVPDRLTFSKECDLPNLGRATVLHNYHVKDERTVEGFVKYKATGGTFEMNFVNGYCG